MSYTPNVKGGPNTADIRDFGATTSADASIAIQAAHDYLIGGQSNAGQNLARKTLYIPSGVWPISSPVFIDGNYVQVVGETGSVLSCKTGNVASYPLIVGFKRYADWAPTAPQSGDPGVFPTSHRMNLSGILDGTIGSPRYGYTSRYPSTHAGVNVADHWIQVWGSPPATGAADYWAATKVFTLELAVENPRGTFGAQSICGMGVAGLGMNSSGSQGGPWTLISDGTQFIFQFNTQEGTGVNRSFRFGDTTVSGVQKLWIEMDFTQNVSGKCLIRCGQNGKQVAVTPGIGCDRTSTSMDFAVPATAGTFTLTAKRLDTGAINTVTINWNDGQTQLNTAMTTLYGATNFSVTQYGTDSGTGVASAFRLTFTGALAALDQQIPIIDTTNATLSGSPGVAVDPQFTAAANIHFAPNYLAPFWFFGQCPAGQEQYINQGGGLTGISVLNLYAFEIYNTLHYSDAGTGNNEIRVDGFTNTDALRYYNNQTDCIVVLGLNDPPNDTTKTSNMLVRFYTGVASQGGVVTTYGWFNRDLSATSLTGFLPPDKYEPAQDISIFNVECEGYDYHAGGGIYQHSTFNLMLYNNRLHNGYQGITHFGGYDTEIHRLRGDGADALLFASTSIGSCEGELRAPVGNCLMRLNGCVWKAKDWSIHASNVNAGLRTILIDGFATATGTNTITFPSSASSINQYYQNAVVNIPSGTGLGQTLSINNYNGSTKVATLVSNWSPQPSSTTPFISYFPGQNGQTDSIVRIHGDGTYGYQYEFGVVDTDNEIPGSRSPLLHITRASGSVGGNIIKLGKLITSGQITVAGQPGVPALIFDHAGGTGTAYAGYNQVLVAIDHLFTDGPEIQIDGPGFEIIVEEGLASCLDVQGVLYSGIPQSTFPVRVLRTARYGSWPPASGRFLAGTIQAHVWNPAAAVVETYVCTVSGTAAYVSTYSYAVGSYVSSGGTEYVCIAASLGNAPASSPTFWTALSSVSTPIWKALSTVAA